MLLVNDVDHHEVLSLGVVENLLSIYVCLKLRICGSLRFLNYRFDSCGSGDLLLRKSLVSCFLLFILLQLHMFGLQHQKKEFLFRISLRFLSQSFFLLDTMHLFESFLEDLRVFLDATGEGLVLQISPQQIDEH